MIEKHRKWVEEGWRKGGGREGERELKFESPTRLAPSHVVINEHKMCCGKLEGCSNRKSGAAQEPSH